MEKANRVEPDLAFIDEIRKSGGGSLKKCFQCATCSVACKLSSDEHPFPRKEMLYASWGLKDRLIGNPDIWLCHNCGDCSLLCPRGARPGDTLSAIRRLSIKAYSKPSIVSGLMDNPRLIPVFFLLPALIIFAVGLSTGLLNFQHDGETIIYSRFFQVSLIEIIFIPLSIMVGLVFFFGIRKMLSDIRTHFYAGGVTNQRGIKPSEFIRTLIRTLTAIFIHKNFSKCEHNPNRSISHMLVSFSFLNLAAVAGIFVFALYILDLHSPYSQTNPVKIVANLSGMALIIGSLLLIKDRMKDPHGRIVYFDWYLLLLILFLGITGMLTQLVRILNWPTLAFTMYFTHLIFAFNLIAFLPYSKSAHFIYRTVAMTYSALLKEKQVIRKRT